ncbi:hypothetical protein EDC94DRAFT_518704 [Helicostylum pulchrum]|nr:hypothetical protein EDC94DRAFT_518704 [Helicostylum pulchrum]
MNQSTFYYEDGQDNVFNENGEKVVDPMEGVLTDITDPNIVLATITNLTWPLIQKMIKTLRWEIYL